MYNFCLVVTLRIVATTVPIAIPLGTKMRNLPDLQLPQRYRNHTKVLDAESRLHEGIFPWPDNAQGLEIRSNPHKMGEL